MINRILKLPLDGPSSIFLFGPRGTGKSSWIRSVHRDALWVDLLEPETFRTYTARPESLRELMDANPRQRTVVIEAADEMHLDGLVGEPFPARHVEEDGLDPFFEGLVPRRPVDDRLLCPWLQPACGWNRC